MPLISHRLGGFGKITPRLPLPLQDHPLSHTPHPYRAIYLHAPRSVERSSILVTLTDRV